MIDIVFSFDTTGSMYPCIAEVRRKVSETAKQLFDTVDDLRIGIMAHGDYCDYKTSYVVKTHELSTDQRSLVNFVTTVPATHGGDFEECYEYVLYLARDFNWREDATKVFVLIADAIPHGVGYTYDMFKVTRDMYWLDQAQQLSEMGVKLYACQALNHVYSTTFYKELAAVFNTPKLDLNQFSDIIPMITAITYKQHSDDLIQQYGQDLQDSGLLNRNMAQIIDALLGDKAFSRTYDVKRPSEFIEVNPARFQVLHVDHDQDIKGFVLSTGAVFNKGRGFYELTKPELIQEYKEVILQDKRTGDFFTGAKAREMLGVPYRFRGRAFKPADSFPYTAFIQSTSVNRKLIAGTKFLYEVK